MCGHQHGGSLVSILGDSISTFEGVTPPAGVFYGPAYASALKVSSVEETWWMQVIHGLGGSLLVNNSYAGSTVSSKGCWPACSSRRIQALSANGIFPDIILIFTGLNDVDYGIPVGDFADDYARMLTRLNQHYPHAEIWCSTLCRGHWSEASYNEMIRSCARQENCRLADLASFGEPYSSTDGAHPDAQGMTQLSKLWLKCLLPKENS